MSKENKEWEFDAEAKTLNDNEFVSDYEIVEIDDNVNNDRSSKDSITISKKSVTIVLSCLIFVVVAAICGLFGYHYFTDTNYEEKMNPGNVALTIGDTKVSVGMYNFIYDYQVNSMTYYANSDEFDPEEDFSKQYTTDDDGNKISWADYFETNTIKTLTSYIGYYELAKKENIELSQTTKDYINTQLNTITNDALENVESDEQVDEYIASKYGDMCGLATLKQFYEYYYTAALYTCVKSIDLEPSNEDLGKYIGENISKYQSCEYAYALMTYDTTSEDTKSESENKAKEYCNSIKSLNDFKSSVNDISKDVIENYMSYYNSNYASEDGSGAITYNDALEKFVGSMVSSDTSENIKSQFSETVSDWLFSSDTNIDDMTYYIDNEYNYIYLVMKTGEPTKDSSKVYGVRHILVTPGEDANSESTEEDGDTSAEKTYTDAEWKDAYAEATEILEEFNKGDKTEKSFAALAEKYSDDTGSLFGDGTSGTYGGVYDGVTQGQMVKEFNDWGMDSSRKYGDVEIVKTTYGYHIIFFVYTCDTYTYSYRTDYIQEKLSDMIKEYPVDKKIGFKNTHVAKPGDEVVYTSSETTY